jgi:gamma-glutamyl-gamma-aminobutyrate hydrolase PuuD
MKNILITQRISSSNKNILQTKLDLDWYDYASKLKFNLIPLGYKFNLSTFKKIKIDGIIFSGGNSLNKYEKRKENILRDKFEINLFNYFKKKNLPILAVCRGMQLITSINKTKLFKTKNHVKKGHDITLNENEIINVNSYHTYLIKKIPNHFRVIAQHTKDKSIEAMKHNTKEILCIMFHPERKSKDQTKVNKLFKNFFKI